MSNRRAGVFDPGCTHSEGGEKFQEADIVLKWGFCLGDALRNRGVDVFFTRTDNETPIPVGSRARLAREESCTHFVSIHVNDADSDQAHGVETLWRHDNQKQFATVINSALVEGLKLRDRGVKERDDLAVLALAQLSREVEKRPDKRPQLSDLRDSGQIEQDADAVLFLLRPEYYLHQAEPAAGTATRGQWEAEMDMVQGKIEFIIAKRRNGVTGSAVGSFHGAFQAVR